MYCVVAYDIPSDSRRRKIGEILKDYGERINYSVFECTLTKQEFAQLKKRILKVLNTDEDSAVYYPLCLRCKEAADYQGICKPFANEQDPILEA